MIYIFILCLLLFLSYHYDYQGNSKWRLEWYLICLVKSEQDHDFPTWQTTKALEELHYKAYSNDNIEQFIIMMKIL